MGKLTKTEFKEQSSKKVDEVLQWLSENSRILVAIALSLLMGFGLISIIANIQDIVRMQRKRNIHSVGTEYLLL